MRQKLDSLTALRFCAALFVVAYHVKDAFQWLYAPLRLLLSHAYVAVPLFFALSGFVLAYTYAEYGQFRGTIRTFWFARFARIYPIYFIAFLLFAPVAFIRVPHFLRAALLTGTLLQAWTDVPDWNQPGWSLSVEAFMYFIFPFLLPLIYRIPRRSLIPACVVGWGVALIAPYALPTHLAQHYPLAHVYEFALGVALFRLHSEWQWKGRSRKVLSAGSALAIIALLALVKMPSLPLHTSLLAPLMGGLILGLAGTDWLSNAWLVSLGSASYSLYILHSPIHVYLKVVASRLFFHESLNDSLNTSSVFALVYMALSVLISLLSYRWIESPARTWLTAKFRPTSPLRPDLSAGGSIECSTVSNPVGEI